MKLITTKKLADLHIESLCDYGIPASRVGTNRIHIEIQKPDKRYSRYFTNEELIVYSSKVIQWKIENANG